MTRDRAHIRRDRLGQLRAIVGREEPARQSRAPLVGWRRALVSALIAAAVWGFLAGLQVYTRSTATIDSRSQP